VRSGSEPREQYRERRNPDEKRDRKAQPPDEAAIAVIERQHPGIVGRRTVEWYCGEPTLDATISESGHRRAAPL
jgi:hypothetical protein